MNSLAAARIRELREAQRATGPASILAIGTANPVGNLLDQESFADYYFKITKSEHLQPLKEKLKIICAQFIYDRYIYLSLAFLYMRLTNNDTYACR